MNTQGSIKCQNKLELKLKTFRMGFNNLTLKKITPQIPLSLYVSVLNKSLSLLVIIALIQVCKPILVLRNIA